MHEDEKWQIYSNNGQPIEGVGGVPEKLRLDKSMIVANTHVWFWKEINDGLEILLQKRATTKSTKPGWYHISSGGHVNIGESSIEAAIRETQEEMGINLDVEKLHYVHSTRIVTRNPNDIVHVYLYKLNGDEQFTYNDGEVDSVEWRTFDNFKTIAKDAETYNLIPQGDLYFNTLIAALEYCRTTTG